MCIFLRRIISVTSILIFVPGLAWGDPPIRVLAYGEHSGENIVYHYTIINNGIQPFNNIVIGSRYDSIEDDTFPELGKLPVGWRYGREDETGVEIILDPGSTTQPAGWVSSVYGQQETAFFYLDWRTSPGGQVTVVQPSQTLSDFSITVPKERDPNLIRMPAGSDLKYLNGHFTVTLPSGSNVQGVIERHDTTPPTFNVSVTPSTIWPPNGKSTSITVSISVIDNYDPAPEIKLESITANELLTSGDIISALVGTDDRHFSLAAKRTGGSRAGRVYTITYSATDASGSKATAKAKVVVPHDQSK